MPLRHFFRNVEVSWKRRSALNRARDRLEVSAIADFLSEHPEQDEAIEAEALRDCGANRTWWGLLLCAGLIMSDSPRALSVLRSLLTPRHVTIPWDRLKADQIAAFTKYLHARNATDECEQFIARLSRGQLDSVRLDPEHPAFPKWLEAILKLKKPIGHVAEILRAYIEERAFDLPDSGGTPPIQRLSICAQACDVMLASGQVEESLGTLTLLSILGIPVKESSLRCVAEALPRLSDYGTERAATLLKQNPSAQWVPALKETWQQIESRVRINPEEATEESLVSALDAAANTVAAALGACCACDKQYRNFKADRELIGEKSAAIERYNRLIAEHNRLVSEYKVRSTGRTRRDQIEKRLEKLREEIEEQQSGLEWLDEDLSAGYLLLQTLCSEQLYPVTVRQGAACGLHLLCAKGHLESETKAEIVDAIRQAVGAKEGRGFCERRVCLLPGFSALDLCHTLTEGLRWMTDLLEGEYASPVFSDDGEGAAPPPARMSGVSQSPLDIARRYPQLRSLVSLLCKLTPKALDFLERHPLRLMPLSHHKQVLGQYTENGCSFSLWTRYTPPKGSGPVHKRYLAVEDRSTPNSMGIYYELFRHPALALPVIYHESLHYGGPAGDPRQGIENETEVLLREIIFARYLITSLAPDDDEDIPAFEESLVEVIEEAGLWSLRWQLGYDLWDDAVLFHINREVISLYGDTISDESAEERFALLIESSNRGIELENRLLKWEKDVTWPLLRSAPTRDLTRRYGEILKRQWKRNHFVSPEQRDRILSEPPCPEHVRAWNEYAGRRHALKILIPPWPDDQARRQAMLRYVVRPFDFASVDSSLPVSESLMEILLKAAHLFDSEPGGRQ